MKQHLSVRNFYNYATPDQVIEEIQQIEKRLDQLGRDGDCAYEKSMVRYYEEQVEMRTEWLNKQIH